jgi:drug/metabolite transporter (DMT)-like permease
VSDLSAAGGDLFGAIAALGAGASWALGSILFRRLADVASPLGLNLAKGLLGLVYLSAALAFTGVVPVDGMSLALLAASGIIGIAIGDTLFFMALVRLEPRRTVLLATIGQAMTVVLALAVLGERPTAVAWVGIVAIVAGVTWVMREQAESDVSVADQRMGIVLGLGAAAAMAVGIILAKMGLARCSALQATAIRLAAGMAALLLIGLARGEVLTWLRPFAAPARLMQLAIADVVIIGGGFYLSMVALELTDATIASVLTATEPLFVLPLAVLMLGERLSRRAIAGALVATAGVAAILAGVA